MAIKLFDEILEEAKSYTVAKTATERALKSLEAIIKATDGSKGEKSQKINKFAKDLKKSYDKNKGFSPDQAKWIYNTSKAMWPE